MASKLPYMVSSGSIPRIFGKMQEARRPDRFTQDFLQTKLGCSGGGARPIIPLLKRMGFLASDGLPTHLYDKFRNSTTQGAAVAQGTKNAYSELFDRNEFAYELSKEKLTGLITEITGAAKSDRTTKATVSTFLQLKAFADFDTTGDVSSPEPKEAPSAQDAPTHIPVAARQNDSVESVGLNLSYTINLNLPETTDPEVFNAIFRALRENLLKQ